MLQLVDSLLKAASLTDWLLQALLVADVGIAIGSGSEALTWNIYRVSLTILSHR
jgi:hypothetical protein